MDAMPAQSDLKTTENNPQQWREEDNGRRQPQRLSAEDHEHRQQWREAVDSDMPHQDHERQEEIQEGQYQLEARHSAVQESRDAQERIDRQVVEDRQRQERAAAFQQMRGVGDARHRRQWDWSRATWSEEYERRRRRERIEEQNAMLAEQRRHIESLIPEHEVLRRRELDDRRIGLRSTYQREHRREIDNEEHQRHIANWSPQQHENKR